MDLVAFTDHDSIDGALELLDARGDLRDVIVGEEVSCRLPDGDVDVHLGVYGMTEGLHRDVQSLRRNVFEVIARLREADVFFSLNHLLHFYRGQVPLEVYLRLLDEVPALEARNGSMLKAHNTLVEQIAVRWIPPRAGRLGMVGGSDAHTLRRVGLTWTSAPGRSREEFMSSLRQGLGQPGGRHGTAAAVAGDAYGVIAKYVAALAGFGPRDHRPGQRAACLGFAAATLPLQFLPLVIATKGKLREKREVVRTRRGLTSAVRSRAEGARLLEPRA
jgi:predicted metal-dependent phosphoesterase TrpH